MIFRRVGASASAGVPTPVMHPMASILRVALMCLISAAPCLGAELKPWRGGPTPGLELRDLDGRGHRLADYRGKVVLVNFWATWCAPCVKEMPALQRLHENLAPQGLRIVAVSVDPAPSPLTPPGPFGISVRDFVERFGLTFTVLHDPTGRIQRVYQSPGLPSTYIIDRMGRIRKKVVGAAAWDEPRFADEIRRLLET